MDGNETTVPLWETVTSWLSDIPIDRPYLIIIFDLCAVGVVLYALRRRRQGYPWWAWPFPMVIPLLLLALVLSINMQFGYVHTAGALFNSLPFEIGPSSALLNPQGPNVDGIVVEVQIPSPASGVGTFPAMIYLPPQYFTSEASARFPVAYLLPGSPGRPSDWFIGGNAAGIGLASANREQPIVLVSPSVGPEIVSDTECVNGVQGNWETYLAVDVVDWVTKNSRVIPGAQGQVISGLSMGGYCAQILALQNPDRFLAYGNFSGFTTPTFDGGLPALFGDIPEYQETVDSYSATWIISNEPLSHVVRNWLGVGIDDSDHEVVQQQLDFVAQAKLLDISVVFEELPGSHTFYLWTHALELWLPWAYSQLPPTSQQP